MYIFTGTDIHFLPQISYICNAKNITHFFQLSTFAFSFLPTILHLVINCAEYDLSPKVTQHFLHHSLWEHDDSFTT